MSELSELADMITETVFTAKMTKWKMDHEKEMMQTEMDHDKEMKNIDVLWNLYDRKQEQYDQALKTLNTTYPGLGQEFITSGGKKLANDAVRDKETNLEALVKDIDVLRQNIGNLEDKQAVLAQQELVFDKKIGDFWGVNEVLQEHEMKQFEEYALTKDDPETPEVVEGLGWETTAGARKAYRDVGSPMEIMKYTREQTDVLKADAEAASDTNYAVLTSQFTPGTDEDFDDVVDRLSYEDASGNTIEVDKEVALEVGNMLAQNTKDQFFTTLSLHPDERVRDILETNPNLNQAFSNLGSELSKVQQLEDELVGKTPEGRFDQFSETVGQMGNKEAAFKFFQENVSGITDLELHGSYFQILENKFGEDLGTQYDEWVDRETGAPTGQLGIGTADRGVTLTENVLAQYDTPEEVYAALERGDVTGSDLAGGGYTPAGRVHNYLGPLRTWESPNYSAATALGGGLWAPWAGDSPYYDAFYESFEDSYDALIDEADPWGPNWLRKSGLKNEKAIPGLLAEKYGEDSEVYQRAYEAADEIGKEKQIEHITGVLKDKEGSDYWNLIRSLNALK